MNSYFIQVVWEIVSNKVTNPIENEGTNLDYEGIRS